MQISRDPPNNLLKSPRLPGVAVETSIEDLVVRLKRQQVTQLLQVLKAFDSMVKSRRHRDARSKYLHSKQDVPLVRCFSITSAVLSLYLTGIKLQKNLHTQTHTHSIQTRIHVRTHRCLWKFCIECVRNDVREKVKRRTKTYVCKRVRDVLTYARIYKAYVCNEFVHVSDENKVFNSDILFFMNIHHSIVIL